MRIWPGTNMYVSGGVRDEGLFIIAQARVGRSFDFCHLYIPRTVSEHCSDMFETRVRCWDARSLSLKLKVAPRQPRQSNVAIDVRARVDGSYPQLFINYGRICG